MIKLSEYFLSYTFSQNIKHYSEAFSLLFSIVSEYDQEIAQSQTADKPVAS